MHPESAASPERAEASERPNDATTATPKRKSLDGSPEVSPPKMQKGQSRLALSLHCNECAESETGHSSKLLEQC